MEYQSNRGFTLIELIVAITVLGILAAIGFPSMVGFINDTRASSSTNEFLGAVTLARSEAIKRGRLVTICRSVNAETGTPACNAAVSGTRNADDWGVGWLVYVEDSAAAAGVGVYAAPEEVLLRHGDLPSKTFASSATANSITFNGSGMPIGGARFGVNFNFNNQNRRQVCIEARTGKITVTRDASSPC